MYVILCLLLLGEGTSIELHVHVAIVSNSLAIKSITWWLVFMPSPTRFLLASLVLPDIHNNDLGSLLIAIQSKAIESSKNCSKSAQVQPFSRPLNILGDIDCRNSIDVYMYIFF